jgi:hypothetical protein
MRFLENGAIALRPNEVEGFIKAGWEDDEPETKICGACGETYRDCNCPDPCAVCEKSWDCCECDDGPSTITQRLMMSIDEAEYRMDDR